MAWEGGADLPGPREGGRLARGGSQAANAKAGAQLCRESTRKQKVSHHVSVSLWYLELASEISQLEMQLLIHTQS